MSTIVLGAKPRRLPFEFHGRSLTEIGRIVRDSLATSVDESSVVGFAGVHGHDLDAGFAMYDTATVSTGAIIVSVSLYGGEASTRSASVLALLELGVPRL